MTDKRIGVFDSGVGGLTVLKELIKEFPNESFYVFGDTGNNPYGVRKPEEIAKLTLNAFKKLEDLGLKSYVIACNTATVHGLDTLRAESDIPVIGVIQPGIETALDTGCQNILVLATAATINSELIQKTLKERNPDLNIEGIAAPDMVIAAENGDITNEKGREVVYKYLDSATIDPDCVMLSCTHFPAFEDIIVEYYKEKGKDIKIVNPAKATAEELHDIMKELDILEDENHKQEVDFYTSGDIEKFKNSGNMILGDDYTIKKANNL